MIDFSKAYISQAIYLVSNKPDPKVRFKQESAEEAFSAFLSAQSQQTNLPDDFDPSQPRLIFQNPPKQLIISQIACQLSLGFEPAQKPLSDQLNIVINNIREVHKKIVKFKGIENLRENAAIISLSIPSKASREDLSGYLFDRFVKLPKYAEVASTSVKAGYLLQSNNFLNIDTDVYEKRGGMIAAGQTIDMMSLPIVEEGITIKVDLNSRPKLNLPGYQNEGPEELITLINEYIPSQVQQLLNAS
ncbi:hypothetical protein [Pseudomonas putida]|uniref:hypothetical protein n=1 Tax=Pseudomonas putida TaxID=303 RepID=UPI00382FD541